MAEERKLVSILFADVTGSTALGDALDPEDVRALMGRYYAHAREVIPAHGGTLEKFIGDAVMAVFGLPQAHGNDAERALAAALALRQAIEGDSLLAGRLVLRMGVNSGEVVAASDPGGGDFLVTGDAVNIAARLEQAANPGEILASARTRAAAEAAMNFGPERTVSVKGKPQPLSVFPLLGARPARMMGRPPLVGRKSDLAQLALLRDRTLEEHRPQLISVVAPAGSGKTRLLEEFLAALPPDAGFRVATARCLPYGQALTFWPLRGLLEELLGGEAFTAERITGTLAGAAIAADEAARVAGLVLASLGVESDGASGPAEREAIFAAWRTLLDSLARAAPRVVVFEDLHWASDSLLDLVEYVMHPRTQTPLLIMTTGRPELLDRRPGWGGGRRSFTALALEPLNQAQTQALVQVLAVELPETMRERIAERSGGNPFFAIELTRAAEEQRGRDAEHEVPLALPDTVHEAVQARLDQLAPRERHVLQAAAVAGRTFRAATLEALVDEPSPSAVSGALDDLLARDLIILAESESDAYTFRHILIRDVAYGTLARGERIRLHAAVAAWLEHFAVGRLDEFAELIAYHYQEAVTLARQSAVPLALPFDVTVAVRSLERAGEVAGRVGAALEARRHLEAAIALAPPEEHLRLYEKLGDAATYGEAALRAYGGALACWRAQGGADGTLVAARLLRKMLIIRVRWKGSLSGRLSEAEMEALRTEARRLAEAAGDEEEHWWLRVADLFWPYWRGSITRAEEAEVRQLAPEVAAHFEARGEWEAASAALDGYGSVLTEVGAFDELAQVAQRRLELPGLSYLERGDAGAMLAWACHDMGDYARSIETARQTMDALGSGISAALLGNAAMCAVMAACFSGRWSELGGLVSKLEEAWEAIGRDAGARYLWGGFAAALHAARAREDHATADRAVAALQRLNQGHSGEFVDHLLAACRDDDVGAIDHLDSYGGEVFTNSATLAVMFLTERGHPGDLALAHWARGHADHLHTDALLRAVAILEALQAGDDTRLAAAVDDAEAHGLIPHAARMRIVLAQRTGDRTHLERARPVLERLGDRQFLRRLEEVASELPEPSQARRRGSARARGRGDT